MKPSSSNGSYLDSFCNRCKATQRQFIGVVAIRQAKKIGEWLGNAIRY